MDNLISLFSNSIKDVPKEENPSPFIVFNSQNENNIFVLSPTIMKLATDIYVADLSYTLNYWNKSAEQKNKRTIDHILKTLNSEIESNTIAVSCEHPFKGLLLINHLLERGATGHYDMSFIFTEKIYKNISFNLWCHSAESINDTFEKYGLLKKERKNFRTNLNQFERFIQRLKLDKISDLKEAHFYEIQRRFKTFIGLLFKWSFPDKYKIEEEINLFNYQSHQLLCNFPWQNFKLFDAPITKNSLEYPLSTWDQITPLLKDDLKKFNLSPHLKYPNKISSLQWTITLFDITNIEAEIFFRYPVSYEEDQLDNFSLILSQFKLGFEQFQFKLKEKTKDTDISNVPLIIAWEIKIDKIVKLKEKTNSLFFDLKNRELHSSEVKHLQNKIEGEISVFKINKVHIPALDYTEADLSTDNSFSTTSDLDNFDYKRILMKPLFIYPKPISIEENELKQKKYLERIAAAWWETNDLNDSYRDYHICKNKLGELVWAYQNYKGEWYVHGLYS